MSNFEDKKEKFRKRYDRLQLLYQWVKDNSISFNEFKELIELLPKIELYDRYTDE